MAGLSPWLSRRGGWARLGLATITGAALTLGHAPVDFPWIFFVALPMAVWLIDTAPGWKSGALVGWGLGFGYFVTGLHWIGHAFLVDADAFAWLLPFAVTLLPAFLGLFWALACGASRSIWPAGHVLRPVLLAAALTGVEMLRSHILTGFPWALPAYAWVETPLLQSASWAGPFGLSLLALALTALPLVAMMERRWLIAAGSMAIFSGLLIWGHLRVPTEMVSAPDAPFLRIVQPNAPQHQKWDPALIPVFYDRLLRHTAAEGDGPRPDVVIWPETAVTFLPTREPEARRQIAEAAGGAPVILGALDVKERSGSNVWFNGLVTVLPDATMGPAYAKHHLVPFGEYMPFRWLFETIGLRQLAKHGGMSPGPGPRTMTISGLPAFAAAICYEMIFPHEVIAAGPRPEWILTATNDAWFGGFAGPQQHLAQARFRAVEQGLPVVRAANTGVSAIIDAHGRLWNTIPLHRDGFIDAKLPAPTRPTIYSFTDSWPTLLACVLVFGLFAARQTIIK